MTGAPAEDNTCAVAHGDATDPRGGSRILVVVFAGEVARHLTAFGTACGQRAVVVEPDAEQAAAARVWAPVVVASCAEAGSDADTDVVVTDHHRSELGAVLRDALTVPARWIGVLGNPRHPGPHEQALADLGVPAAEIARVHRPIGLNIGSRTPPEIAIATLAGLIAERAGRPGGFAF